MGFSRQEYRSGLPFPSPTSLLYHHMQKRLGISELLLSFFFTFYFVLGYSRLAMLWTSFRWTPKGFSYTYTYIYPPLGLGFLIWKENNLLQKARVRIQWEHVGRALSSKCPAALEGWVCSTDLQTRSCVLFPLLPPPQRRPVELLHQWSTFIPLPRYSVYFLPCFKNNWLNQYFFFPYPLQHLLFVEFLMMAIWPVWDDISLWFWFAFL